MHKEEKQSALGKATFYEFIQVQICASAVHLLQLKTFSPVKMRVYF